MLPRGNRLRRSTDFPDTTRRGVRAARSLLVVHVAPPGADADLLTRMGLSVGKGVGGSVVRHKVSRRLRAEIRGRLWIVPIGSTIVVRALPRAASASSATLGRELESALMSAASKLAR